MQWFSVFISSLPNVKFSQSLPPYLSYLTQPHSLSFSFTQFTTSTVLTLSLPPLHSSPLTICTLRLLLQRSPDSLSFLIHLRVSSSPPSPLASLPASGTRAALHGQRAPWLINSQNSGNTRKTLAVGGRAEVTDFEITTWSIKICNLMEGQIDIIRYM